MKVIFQIQGGAPVTAECNSGDNLLETAQRANVAIDAPCSGKAASPSKTRTAAPC